jgi:hypothetical protein
MPFTGTKSRATTCATSYMHDNKQLASKYMGHFNIVVVSCQVACLIKTRMPCSQEGPKHAVRGTHSRAACGIRSDSVHSSFHVREQSQDRTQEEPCLQSEDPQPVTHAADDRAAQEHRIASSRQSLQEFETQYNDLQRLLATQPSRPAGSRRRGTQPVHAHDNAKDDSAAHVRDQPHQQSAELSAGSEGVEHLQRPYACQGGAAQSAIEDEKPIDLEHATMCLLSQALRLKELIVDLAASLLPSQCPQSNPAPSRKSSAPDLMGPSASSCSRRNDAVSGRSRAQEALQLASLKALTSSAELPLPQLDLCANISVRQGCAREPCLEEQENCADVANVPLMGDAGPTPKPEQCHSPPQQLTRSLASTAAQDCADVDTAAELHVTRIADVQLPPAAASMLKRESDVGIWLAWRIPGTAGAAPCLKLMQIQPHHQLRWLRNGCLHLQGGQLDVHAQVSTVHSGGGTSREMVLGLYMRVSWAWP